MDTLEQTRSASAAWADRPLSEKAALQYEVEQFLYAEAAMLDARRYREWLELIAEDIHYWMPIRRTPASSRRWRRPSSSLRKSQAQIAGWPA